MLQIVLNKQSNFKKGKRKLIKVQGTAQSQIGRIKSVKVQVCITSQVVLDIKD